MGMSKRIKISPFPRCLAGMSCVYAPPEGQRRRPHRGIRVVRSDGAVKIYDRPIKASELMEGFPKHMACRSDSFYIGRKTAPLAADDPLLPGHTYFLLPATFFQSAVSFSSFLRCRSSAAAAARSPAFEVEKTPSGSLRIKVTEEMIFRLQEEEEMEAAAAAKVVRICTTAQLRKDYELLVARRFHWKPKLDTIAEKKSRQKKKTKKKISKKNKSETQ
ncbi:uncharacterized protein LOC127241322 [Andrographis paniculata]|uniref:uncharacterized protein LOC127241322 n=1 Tax=Andrographis paniculata TaxID=175694 RepID=UPI0021E90A04|nr:uncharacterized protein LOC127241322 [Andrographis paniculata]